MALTDLALPELWTFADRVPDPDGVDEFWAGTLAEAATVPLDVRIERVATPLTAVETYDVTYAGFGGHPVRAWLHLPAAALRDGGPLPGVVQYQGYNGGRGLAHEHVFWATAGFAHLVMDTRGQGSGWTVGETPDPAGSGAAQPGYLTRGIESPAEHYYRRVFVDAVRAVEVLRAQPGVDPDRVAVTGHSQGGGITLAVAALSDGVVAAMPDVPFLCHFRRGAQVAAGDPYAEIVRYLGAHRDRAEPVFDTLGHFDGAVLGRRARVPALFSVAVMDSVCPPSTVFAAFHAYAGPKRLEVYEYNDHEGGGPLHLARQAGWLRDLLG